MPPLAAQPGLELVIKRCLAHQPTERPHAAVLAEQLHELHVASSAPAAAAAAGGRSRAVSFIISYASLGNSRVEETKQGLEARGHRVFYGKEVRVAAKEDWRKQWCVECMKADVSLNFLCAAYARSQSCAEEWAFIEAKKPRERVINLMVGGSSARAELMALPVEEVADKGGMKILMHFDTGGQALSVYEGDDIVQAILEEVKRMPELLVDDEADDGSAVEREPAELRAEAGQQAAAAEQQAALAAQQAAAADSSPRSSGVQTLAELAAAVDGTVQELLGYSEADLVELAREKQLGVAQRNRVLKEAAELKAKEAVRAAAAADVSSAAG